ncbi:hypothetical protein VULLAG_LOCUS19789 [Vulpes lagopus]
MFSLREEGKRASATPDGFHGEAGAEPRGGAGGAESRGGGAESGPGAPGSADERRQAARGRTCGAATKGARGRGSPGRGGGGARARRVVGAAGRRRRSGRHTRRSAAAGAPTVGAANARRHQDGGGPRRLHKNSPFEAARAVPRLCTHFLLPLGFPRSEEPQAAAAPSGLPRSRVSASSSFGRPVPAPPRRTSGSGRGQRKWAGRFRSARVRTGAADVGGYPARRLVAEVGCARPPVVVGSPRRGGPAGGLCRGRAGLAPSPAPRPQEGARPPRKESEVKCLKKRLVRGRRQRAVGNVKNSSGHREAPSIWLNTHAMHQWNVTSVRGGRRIERFATSATLYRSYQFVHSVGKQSA